MHVHVFEMLCVLFMVVKDNVNARVRCATVCEVCAEWGGCVGDWSGTSAHAHGGAILSQTLGL